MYFWQLSVPVHTCAYSWVVHSLVAAETCVYSALISPDNMLNKTFQYRNHTTHIVRC